MNTAEFLQISSMTVPDREAIVCGETRRTFAELYDRVLRLANALQGLGVERGRRIAVMGMNSAEYVEVYYACSKLGATFVPLNYRAKTEELDYMINTAETDVLFVGERYAPLVEQLRPQLKSVRRYVGIDGAAAGMLPYAQLVAEAPNDEIFVDVDDDDANVLMYTSGTTAMPKGVVLTYLTLTSYVVNTMEPATPDKHEVTLLSVPIAHVAGLTAIISSMWGGRTLVVLPQFSEGAWLQAVEQERVTHSFIVPTMLKRVMEHQDFSKTDLSSLKLIAYGAAPMPYEVVRKAVEVFDCGLMNAYGQTESTSTLTYLGPEDHDIKGLTGEALEQKLHRLRSVGRPMDDVAVVLMNDHGEILAPGQEGEICVAGARVMKEYFKQADATSEAIVEGWLHTGDVGYMDEDNYLFITGRKKDLIIRGGENISPGEIEAVLESHPRVEEAAVIGVPDAHWGEVVKAIVVPKPGERVAPEEMREYAKARLASYKAPEYVTIAPELPRNALGKILKTELRKLYGTPSNN